MAESIEVEWSGDRRGKWGGYLLSMPNQPLAPQETRQDTASICDDISQAEEVLMALREPRTARQLSLVLPWPIEHIGSILSRQIKAGRVRVVGDLVKTDGRPARQYQAVEDAREVLR